MCVCVVCVCVYARLCLCKCVYCVFIHLLLLLILRKVSCYHDNCVHGDLRVSGRKCLPLRLSLTRKSDEVKLLYLLLACLHTPSTLSSPQHNLAVPVHKYINQSNVTKCFTETQPKTQRASNADAEAQWLGKTPQKDGT